MSIVVSAPGKTILMGEHAAVYGRPALVAAVDRRLYAEFELLDAGEVRLTLPAVEVSESVTWEAIREYTRLARLRWQRYEADPSPAAFERLRGSDPAHLVKIALGETMAFLGVDEPPGIELRLHTQIPIGAGFGSSAAVAVATVYGCISLCGEQVDASALEWLGLEIERRQHGLPSGIDSATVVHGGLIWALSDASGRFSTNSLAGCSAALHAIRVFNSGTPVESTGAVVAAVRERYDTDSRAVSVILDRMEAATRELRRRLETSDGAPMRLAETIREFESCLESLGVVPPRLCEIVRQVEARGGAAKISGAGALTGRGAGSLLVYHPDPTMIDSWRFLDDLEYLDVRLGAGGVRLERQVR